MFNDNPFDPETSVNDIVRRFPESVLVFKSLGVDACCRGTSSLEKAAHDAGITLDTLTAALEKVASEEPLSENR